jgi:hypothetical protein
VVARYFAYGSNMNPARVVERGIRFHHLAGAVLTGFELVFDKTSKQHAGMGHANLRLAPGRAVEGVLYWLESPLEISKMDRFENTPINYSREVISVAVRSAALPEEPAALPELAEKETQAGEQHLAVSTWTYFANPAVRRPNLLPPRSYLDHLLAGRPYLSDEYYEMLATWPCNESR